MEQHSYPTTFKKIAASLTLSFSIFIVFYWLLKFFYNQIHFSSKIENLNNLNPWISKYIHMGEGSELPAMLLTSIMYLSLAYFAFIYIDKLKFAFNKLFQLAIMLVSGWILIRSLITRPAYPPQRIEDIPTMIIYIFIAITIVFIISRLNFSNKGWHFFILTLWTAFSIFFILSLGNASILDYNFSIAPALKIQQGEKIGSFLIQYNLLETYIFKVMMDFGFKLRQMQLTFVSVFILWFLIYYYIAYKLIKKQFLIALFIFLLFFLKFLALESDPTSLPQQLPLRLGLWTILIASILRFGFWSFITSLAFGVIYILDNSFGLMYLIAYLSMTLIFNLKADKNKSLMARIKKYMQIFSPLAVCVFLNFYFFNAFLFSSVKAYTSLNLGFIPIMGDSIYWIIFAFLPIILYIYLQEINIAKRQVLIFLLVISLFQMTYFYGRSFEINLQNISDLLLLLIFLALDILVLRFNRKILAIIPVVLIIIFSTYMFYGYIQIKTKNITHQLSKIDLLSEHPADTFFDQSLRFLDNIPDKNKLIFINTSERTIPDGYVNYRSGLRQVGYFSPFMTHIYAEETVEYILEKLAEGYNIVFLDDETKYILSKYNKMDLLQKMNKKLVYYLHNNLYFIKLEEGSWRVDTFNLENNLVINLSPAWIFAPGSKNKIIGYDNLIMEISVDSANNKTEAEFVVIENNTLKYQIYKKINNKIINISLSPIDQAFLDDSYLKKDFRQMVNSISLHE